MRKKAGQPQAARPSRMKNSTMLSVSTYGASTTSRFLAFTNALEWKRGALDESSWRTFVKARSLGIPKDFAVSIVSHLIGNAGVSPRSGKLRSQLDRAYSQPASNKHIGSHVSVFPKAKSRTCDALPNCERIAEIVSLGFGCYDLWESSPIRFAGEASHSEQIVDALFPSNPLLSIGRSFRDRITKPREFWRGRLSRSQFIVPSPMSAEKGSTTDGRSSGRSLSNTGLRRFIVVEFDQGTTDDHASLINHLGSAGAALALVVFSGNKSLHGWFFCDGVKESALRSWFDYAITLGADRQMWVRSQFTRIPDGRNGRTGQRQSVLYFDPGFTKGAQ